MYFMYFVLKRQKIAHHMWVLLYVFDHLQLISMGMGLSLVWMQLHKLCIMVFNLSSHSESCNILHFLDVNDRQMIFTEILHPDWLIVEKI